MPNDCGNKLGVAGPFAEVRRFIKNARGRPIADSTSEPEEKQAICFQKLYPASTSDELVPDCPPGSPPEMCQDQVPAWYADRIQKWGTELDAETYGSAWGIRDSNTVEWDPSDEWRADNEECCATIRFDTASSPPLALFNKVAADYPKLTFRLRYLELGNGLYGVAEWRDGAQVQNDKMDWETIDVVDWIGPEDSLDDRDDGDDDDGPIIAEVPPSDNPSP